MSIKRPPKQLNNDVESVLGKFSSQQINDIVFQIKKDGYYIFDQKLGEKLISEINEFAVQTPTRKMIDLGNFDKVEVLVNPDSKPESPRYQYQNEKLLTSKALNKIICDNLFLTISERYLNCRPFFDYFVMWWSFPFGNKLTSAAAQEYHYDLDRFRFLKFFFYVSDVTKDTGPHCFIKGSHETRINELRIDGRIDDTKILQHYNSSDVIEIEGLKGSVIAVDTIGLHKGKPLVKGCRLLFQILYSNSLFGPEITKVGIPEVRYNENKVFLDTNKDVFQSTLTY